MQSNGACGSNRPHASRCPGAGVVGPLFALLLMAAGLAAGSAEAQPFHAGVARIAVPADTPPAALVWYPTEADEEPWQLGVVPMPATRDAAVAAGRFPVVLLSHGGGASGGSPLMLRALSVALARQGMIVVAPFHGPLLRTLVTRPRQTAEALQVLLADERFAPHADPARVGMVGFSLGGGIALLVAGGRVDMAHWAAYCTDHHEDYRACSGVPSGVPSGSEAAEAGVLPAAPSLPLKALVLLDPFGAVFTRDSLSSVVMPVLILHPVGSDLSESGNAEAVAEALPNVPQYERIAGTHFIFADSCIGLPEQSADWCQDPPGVDRAAVHAQVEAMIVAFLRGAL